MTPAAGARDLAQHGIRVTPLAPGIFATPFSKELPQDVQTSLARLDSPFPSVSVASEFASLAAHFATNGHLNGRSHPPRWCPAHGPALTRTSAFSTAKPLPETFMRTITTQDPRRCGGAGRHQPRAGGRHHRRQPAADRPGLPARHPHVGQRHQDVAHQHRRPEPSRSSCMTTRPDLTKGVQNANRFVVEDKADLVIGSAATPVAVAGRPARWLEAQTMQIMVSYGLLPPARTPGASASPRPTASWPTHGRAHEGPGASRPSASPATPTPTARLAQDLTAELEKNGGGIQRSSPPSASPALTPPSPPRRAQARGRQPRCHPRRGFPAPAQPCRTRRDGGAATKARSTRRMPPPRAT